MRPSSPRYQRQAFLLAVPLVGPYYLNNALAYLEYPLNGPVTTMLWEHSYTWVQFLKVVKSVILLEVQKRVWVCLIYILTNQMLSKFCKINLNLVFLQKMIYK